jgi:hypothetical protein
MRDGVRLRVNVVKASGRKSPWGEYIPMGRKVRSCREDKGTGSSKTILEEET